MTIRKKILFWFLLPSLLIIAATAVFNYFYTQETVKQNVFDKMEIAADVLHEHIHLFLDEKRGRAHDFASDGFIKIHAEKIINRIDSDANTFKLNRHLLYNKKPLDEDVLEVFVVDLNGKVISSTEITQLNKDISYRSYFTNTIKRGHSISNLHNIPEFNQNIFEVSRLIKANEGVRPIGILVNRYDGVSIKNVTRSGMTEIRKGSQLRGLGETGELYIVNKDKLMISESRFIEDSIYNQVVDTEGVRVAFDNKKGMVGIYPDYRGIPIIGASRYIEDVDWVVLAEKDVSEAFAPIKRLRNFFIITGVIGVMVITAVAFFLSRGISNPIQKLVTGTKRISEGDLAFDIEVMGRDEIGYLGKSFNDMTQKLGESKKLLQDYTDNLEEKVKEKTKEVIKAREYTENIIETAQDAIICIDEMGIINVWNRSAEKVFGYSKKEIMGKPVITIIPEKYREGHLNGIERFLKTHRHEIIGKIIDVSGKTREGIEVPIELSISFQKIEEGRYSFTAIIRDITERKEAEKERKRILDELRDKNKELEQVIYVTSHDFRSPLVNIMGFSKELGYSVKNIHSILKDENISSALEKKLAPAMDEDIPEALKYILASTSKMDSLLNGLLRISRMGRVKLRIKQLDMDKLMSDVAGNFEHRIKEMGVTLKVDSLPPCNGDEVQINQVFSNLLDNALKYLDPKRPGVIKISGTRQLVYCVEDNGIGIAQEHHKKVYEIFHRLNPKGVAGEGLGLTTVRKILERHGGKIWCESSPGKGSKFFVAILV